MYIVLLSFNIYYDPAPPSYNVVANCIYPPVYSIVTTRKGACIQQCIIYLSVNLSSVVLLGTPVVLLNNKVLTGSL